MAGVLVLFLGVALAMERGDDPRYIRSAVIQLRALDYDGAAIGVYRPFLQLSPGGMAQRAALLSNDPAIRRRVILRLAREGLLQRGVPSIAASPIGNLERVTVQAQGTDERLAARSANLMAEELVDEYVAAERALLDRALEDVRRSERSAARRARGSDAADRYLASRRREELELQEFRLRVNRAVAAPARIYARAAVDEGLGFTTPVGMKATVVMGVGVALLMALLLEVADRRPRSARRLSAASGLRLLGAVPASAGPDRAGDGRRIRELARLGALLRASDTAGSAVYLTPVQPDAPGLADELAEAMAAEGRAVRVVGGRDLAAPPDGDGETELTIVAGPALWRSADALELARLAGRAVLVARARRTTAEEIRVARAALERAGAVVEGLVVVDAFSADDAVTDPRRLRVSERVPGPRAVLARLMSARRGEAGT